MKVESKICKRKAGRVHLNISVEPDEIDAAFNQAEEAVRLLEKRPLDSHQLGENPAATRENAIATRATRAIVEEAIHTAVEEHDLRLTSNVKSEVAALAIQGEPYSFEVDVDVVPDFGIAPYDKLQIKVPPIGDVSETDIDEKLGEICSRAAKTERDSKRPISNNDIVELSFESFIEGEPYDGSVVSNYAYTLGSNLLPEAFEDGLVGMSSGDSGIIEFVIPADYENKEIAGKEARFDVTIGRVASIDIPQADDAFAKSFGYESLGAWRDKLRFDISEQRKAEREEAKEKATRQALADLLEGDVPKEMIKQHAERMLQAYRADLTQQGVSFDEYLGYLGITEQDVRDEMTEQSAEMLRENLALESLFKSEGLIITDEELNSTVREIALDGGMEQFPNYGDFNTEQGKAIREMTVHRMATEWIMKQVEYIETEE